MRAMTADGCLGFKGPGAVSLGRYEDLGDGGGAAAGI